MSLVLFGVSIASFIYSAALIERIRKARREIEFRKKQLSKPVYEIKPEEATYLPWDSKNIKQWLYRPVRITGRPLHYRAMLIPRKCYGHEGYEYVVPFVLKEDEDGSN